MSALRLACMVVITLVLFVCIQKLLNSHFRRFGKKRRVLLDWHSTFPWVFFSTQEWIKFVGIIVAWAVLMAIAMFVGGGSNGDL